MSLLKMISCGKRMTEKDMFYVCDHDGQCEQCIEEDRDQWKELAQHAVGAMCDASYLRKDQVKHYLKAKELMQ